MAERFEAYKKKKVWQISTGLVESMPHLFVACVAGCSDVPQ